MNLDQELARRARRIQAWRRRSAGPAAPRPVRSSRPIERAVAATNSATSRSPARARVDGRVDAVDADQVLEQRPHAFRDRRSQLVHAHDALSRCERCAASSTSTTRAAGPTGAWFTPPSVSSRTNSRIGSASRPAATCGSCHCSSPGRPVHGGGAGERILEYVPVRAVVAELLLLRAALRGIVPTDDIEIVAPPSHATAIASAMSTPRSSSFIVAETADGPQGGGGQDEAEAVRGLAVRLTAAALAARVGLGALGARLPKTASPLCPSSSGSCSSRRGRRRARGRRGLPRRSARATAARSSSTGACSRA